MIGLDVLFIGTDESVAFHIYCRGGPVSLFLKGRHSFICLSVDLNDLRLLCLFSAWFGVRLCL